MLVWLFVFIIKSQNVTSGIHKVMSEFMLLRCTPITYHKEIIQLAAGSD